MATRTLNSPPPVLPLYARAAASMIPGASLLPFVPGGGKDIPDVDLRLTGVRPERDKVAAYAQVCGFALRDELPATYPHVLAFPLHMALMADGRFPFGAMGLVHIENRIVQHRPIELGEELEIGVRATKLEPHRSGRAFSFVSEAFAGGELVWEDVSRILRRGGGTGERSPRTESEVQLEPVAEWPLGEDLGRRYAAVSGDRNPIHMHALTAKPLGFPKAIAHGMWTKARCLAALQGRLPDAFAVEVRFRKPILLPATVAFSSARHGAEIDFEVQDANKQIPHLAGRVRPLQQGDGRAPDAADRRNPA
jgi:acyl dehydratase